MAAAMTDEHLTAEEIAHGQRLAPIWEAWVATVNEDKVGLIELLLRAGFTAHHEQGRQVERARILAALAAHGYHRWEPVEKRWPPRAGQKLPGPRYTTCAHCDYGGGHVLDWLFDLLEEAE